MLPAMDVDAIPNEQCPDGIPWDYVGGFNVKMRLVDLKQFLPIGDCLRSVSYCILNEFKLF
jgi:hypothetical protein